MGYANANGSMAVTTGNKSEIAQGYCTLYGDMAGAMHRLATSTKWTCTPWPNVSISGQPQGLPEPVSHQP